MILLTGYTGFLGSFLLSEFLKAKKKVICVGRNKDSDWVFNFETLENSIPERQLNDDEIDLLVHVAGLAHFVPKTSQDGDLFYNVNVEGTREFLRVLKINGWLPKRILFISTIAVYGENVDLAQVKFPHPLDSELDLLNTTIYGRSKLLAEELIRNWCFINNSEALIWRIPLILGPKAPGNLGAMEKAIKRGYYFRIGDSYKRFRYYVTLEYISDLILGNTSNHELFLNTGTYNVYSGKKSYGEFEDEIASRYNRKIRKLPIWLVLIFAFFGSFIPGFPLDMYRFKKLMNQA